MTNRLTDLFDKAIRHGFSDEQYECFYNNSQTAQQSDIAITCEHIYTFKPVQSYSFTDYSVVGLYLSSILDSECITLSNDIKSKLLKLLVQGFNSISDFNPYSADGELVHGFNHWLFFAESAIDSELFDDLSKEEICNVAFAAFLRSEVSFAMNEDLLLANIIFKACSDTYIENNVLKLLTPSKPTSEKNLSVYFAQEFNKRLLWQSMYSNFLFKNSYFNVEFEKLRSSVSDFHLS